MEDNWKSKIIVMGVVIGAIAGAVSAFMLIKKAENEHTTPKLTAGEGIQVGLGVLGVMRMIAGLGIE